MSRAGIIRLRECVSSWVIFCIMRSINPIDAQKRGIANGDMVRVFNHRGEVRLPAKVTPRILPGVSAMGQGVWHEANMSGDKIDHGGCVNTLTTLRPSPLAKGNPQHTNLVEIEKI